jgi:hypothetical protein
MADQPKQDDNKKSEFGTPQQVFDVCKSMADVEDKRASDRVKINSLFNGQRPYSKSDEEKYHIQVNVNWGEGKRIMMDANRQLNNALLHSGILFNCTLEEGRVDKRDEWSQVFTTEIHKPFQRGRSGKRHNFLIRNRNATVCMHGIGAMLWPNDHRWLARFVPLEDLLIPTDTYSDFSNLRYFAVNLYLTPGELVDMAFGDAENKRWDKKMVKGIMDANRKLYTESTSSTWRDQPEAMKQIHDQNKGYYYSDVVPKIKLRMFFWREVEKPKRWYRHIVLREGYEGVSTDKFLYNGSGQVFADDIDHILNVQFGDANLTAPLKYHSVRGLGVDLFAPVETINRLRCDYVWAVFEHLRMLFKIQDPADRDRLKEVVLQQFGFIPDGLTIVPRDQRHQIDPRLVDDAMSQMRGLMQENSSAYVTDKDSGGEKEMTAKEAMIKLNQASAMVNSMLGSMYLQEAFYYQEEVRRFLVKNPSDEEVKDFQSACKRQGIPDEMMNVKYWRVEPEKVLGGGDRSLAQQEAMWLMQNKTQYDPRSQQIIMRTVTSTMLNDPAKAKLLVPDAPVTSTAGSETAENVFGTLMTGNQVSLRQGIDQQGYVVQLLKMMGAVVQRIAQTGGVGTIDEIIGLQTAAQNAVQHIQIIAADQTQKQLVKQVSDVLGKIMNEVKAFGQRWMEQQKSQQSQGDPATMAKAQGAILMAKTKAQINIQNAELKRKQKELDFGLDQQRQNLALVAEMRREDAVAKQEAMHEQMQKTLDLMHEMRAMSMREKASEG